MIISINNTVIASNIFIAIFIVALLLSMRRSKSSEIFSLAITNELKGLAILAIVFSHIGYFLVDDHRFLFPLSIMAGVGVNLFLFLSGFGLTISSLKSKKSIWSIQLRRIFKMLIPFWIILAIFFLLDYFVLKKSYSLTYLVQSFFAWFPRADVNLDLNSPLWYFTLILFYYLIIPLLFFRKYPWLSAILIYATTYYIIQSNPIFLKDAIHLYRVHIMAFPLGIFISSVFFYSSKARDYLLGKFQKSKLKNLILCENNDLKDKHKSFEIGRQLIRVVFSAVLLYIFFYTAYNSRLSEGPAIEQYTSLITMTAIIILFLIKKIEFKLLYIFGFYSYEIYLLHWPILYRYDLFFKFMPAWLAVCLYLVLFLGLGWILKKIHNLFV